MIRVQIEFDHYDGRIDIVRTDDGHFSEAPSDTLRKVVAAAEASAVAAMKARPER